MRPKANPGTDGGGGDGGRRPRRTAWCASILLVVTTLVALNIVGVILRSAVERETTDQTYRRQMMARFYRGDPVRESGNQRETGNAIGVSGASTTATLASSDEASSGSTEKGDDDDDDVLKKTLGER